MKNLRKNLRSSRILSLKHRINPYLKKIIEKYPAILKPEVRPAL